MINYIDGFKQIFENSKRLYTAAEVLADKHEFPIANSLLVLSAEEAIKGTTVLARHFFPEGDLEDFYKSFASHKVKIEGIRSFLAVTGFINAFIELYYEPMINAVNQKEDIKEVRKKSIEKLRNWLENEASNMPTELKKEAEWWKHANVMKQHGFYMGLNKGNGKWESPTRINRSKYGVTKEYVDRLISKVEVLYKIDLEDDRIVEVSTMIVATIRSAQ